MAGYFDDPKYRAQPAAPKSGGYFSDPKYIASPTTTPPVEDPGYIETGITSVARGGGSIVSGLGAAAEWAGDVTGSQGLRQFGQEAQKLGTQIIEGPGKLEGPSFTGTFMENPSLKRAFSLAAEAVPSLALGLATGGATALGLRGAGLAATTARTAGTLAGAGTLGVTEGAPQYIEAKQAGKSVGKASAIGAASTIGTTALEFIGLGSLIKGAAKGAIKGAVKGFLSEGTQEATQQVWQNLVAKLGYDESKSLVEGVVESFIAGSGSGAAVGGVTGRINSRRDNAQTALLTKHFPNAEVKVSAGVANIKYQSDTGAVEAQIPVANLSKAIAAGVNVEDLIGISSAVKQGVEAATTEQTPKPKFERLEDLPENPAVLRMSIGGNEYQYLPRGDMSRVDMEAQLEGKTLPQQVAWLRKNADLIRGPKDAQENGSSTQEGSTQEGIDRGEGERLRVRDNQQSGEGQAAQEVGATQAPVTEAAEVGGAPPMFSVEQVKQEAKSFLGEGYDTLENSGKIAVVNTEAELPANIKNIIPPGSKVRGVYDPVSKKVYLVAGSLQQGMAKDVILHEGVHAILREDTAFSKNREKIITDFVSLAEKNASVKEALSKVPGATRDGRVNEEALAYWMQNPKNHKHSLFRRIIATVKAAMFRAGIPTGKLSTADLSKIFTGGIQTWARAAQAEVQQFSQSPFYSLEEAESKIQNLPAFKRWFAGSKVVDKNGKPLVVYHGTPFGNFRTRAERINAARQQSITELRNIRTNVSDLLDLIQSVQEERKTTTDRKRAVQLDKDLDHAYELNQELQRRRDSLLAVTPQEAIQEAEIFSARGTNDPGYLGSGIYFTEDKQIAKEYAAFANRSALIGETKEPFIYEVFLDMKKPFYQGKTEVTSEMAKYEREEYELLSRYSRNDPNKLDRAIALARTNMLKHFGFDGVIGESAGKEGTEYVAFEPTQIKSIFNDKWDGSNPDIMFSLVSDELKKVQNKAETIAKAAANPKATGKRIYESTASTWLGVLPPSFKAQVFKIPYLKNLVDHTNSLIATKTKIADDSFYIYDNAVKVANSEKGVDTLNNALLVGTFNQMYPWAGVMKQDWVPASVENEDGTTTTNNAARLNAAEKAWKTAGMKKSTGKTFREAHAEAYKAWNTMGPKTKTEALKITESLTELRQRERDNLLKYIIEASQDDPQLRAELMARFDASFNQLKGIYAPLSRYGNWTVDYITPTGQRSSNFFDTELDRDEFVKTITAEGVDPNNIVTSIKKETPNGAVVIPNELVQQITGKLVRQYTTGVDPNDAEAMADAQERARDVVSDINQTFLRWLPDTSALKNSIHRKNVLGASTDMMRSYLDYMQRHASKIAWMEVGKKLDLEVSNFAQDIREQEKERGVDTTMQVQLLNDARRWLQAIRTEKVNAAASIAGKISTAYYMTSPSTFLVQLTQLPALTLPNLGTRFGYGRASKSLSAALVDAFSPKYSKEAMLADDKVNEVYEAIHAVVSEREATPENPVGTERLAEAEREALIKSELNDDQKRLLMLREAVAMNLLDISAVHEAQDISFGRETTIAGKLMKYAMLPMQHGELGSRKAAALATYELATAKNKDFYQAMDEIKKTIDETLYSYAKENKGYLLQGSVPRVLLTFQTYRINTALRLGMLMAQSVKGETAEVRKAAQREFVGIMGMSSALAGTAGTVISPLVFAIANILFGSDDEPYDAELEFTNWLKESLGQTAGEAAAYGLPTLLGTNISKRIGMGDIYGTSTEPPPGTHGSDLAYWYAGNLLGPSFSVAQSWFRGYDEIVNKGNYLKGLEVGSPKPIKDALKAYRIATEGLKTGSGKKLLDDSAIGPDEILMTALGFNPDEIASAQNAERSLQKLSAQISERRGKLIRDAANAIVDSEDPEKAYQAIRTFNARMPRFTILGRDIAPAVRKQLLGEFGTTGLRERMVAEEYGIDVKAP